MRCLLYFLEVTAPSNRFSYSHWLVLPSLPTLLISILQIVTLSGFGWRIDNMVLAPFPSPPTTTTPPTDAETFTWSSPL